MPAAPDPRRPRTHVGRPIGVGCTRRSSLARPVVLPWRQADRVHDRSSVVEQRATPAERSRAQWSLPPLRPYHPLCHQSVARRPRRPRAAPPPRSPTPLASPWSTWVSPMAWPDGSAAAVRTTTTCDRSPAGGWSRPLSATTRPAVRSRRTRPPPSTVCSSTTSATTAGWSGLPAGLSSWPFGSPASGTPSPNGGEAVPNDHDLSEELHEPLTAVRGALRAAEAYRTVGLEEDSATAAGMHRRSRRDPVRGSPGARPALGAARCRRARAVVAAVLGGLLPDRDRRPDRHQPDAGLPSARPHARPSAGAARAGRSGRTGRFRPGSSGSSAAMVTGTPRAVPSGARQGCGRASRVTSRSPPGRRPGPGGPRGAAGPPCSRPPGRRSHARARGRAGGPARPGGRSRARPDCGSR